MKDDALEFLRDMLSAPSPSGYEGPVREIWVDRVGRYADDVRVDVHGNAIATLNPEGSPHVMLAGHMDEIGFQVVHITDKGFIRFRPIGGHDIRALAGRRVEIHSKRGPILGVIGKKPVHLERDRTKSPAQQPSAYWIDCGYGNRREAEKQIEIGDPITYVEAFSPLRGKLAVSRAFDNKVGAWVVGETLIALSRLKTLKARVSAVATVQEEIGLRGAHTSAFGLEPDAGVAVDVTWATDDPSADANEIGEVKLGKGPVLVRGPNANAPFLALTRTAAKQAKIPYQLRAIPRGTGTDANAMQLSRAGMAVLVVGVPQRYMHSPVEIVHLGDLDACVKLIAASIRKMSSQTSFVPK